MSNKLKKNNFDININVGTEYKKKKSFNIVTNLKGTFNSGDAIVLGAHHDTTFDSLGANDNASGLSVLLETARLLKQLKSEIKMIQKISQYFYGVQVETKKVTWLSKAEMLSSTVIVGVFSVMIALFLFFVDFGLSEFVSRIIGGK